MAWTYDTTLPVDKDKVRLLIGDTFSTDPQLSDEEIDAILALYGSVARTAVGACRMLAAKYSRNADKWVGDLKILASQKAKAYLALAEELEDAGGNALGVSSGVPTAGGINVTEKELAQDDTTRVVPFFRRGLHDNLGCD